MVDAGYSGRGFMTALEKIRSRQWFGSDDFPTYLSTHPGSEDRISHIDSWLHSHTEADTQTLNIDPYPFQFVQTRLIALYGDEDVALKKYQSAMKKSPNDTMANYGYALILAKTGDRLTAIEHLKVALEKRAFDPYMLSEIGKLYYLEGQYQEALDTLEGAVSISPDYPDGVFYLSKTYMETGKLEKAVILLEDMIAKTPDQNLARYALAESYGKLGETGQAHYHLGLYYFNKKDAKNALFHLKRASQNIKDPEKLKKIDKKIKFLEKQIAGDQKRQRG
jgi:predicted Zn-dependent protease